MNLIFKKADVSKMGQALDLFRTTSLKLKDRGLSQWSYWHEPPPEKVAWVQEGFENGEFHFVYAPERIGVQDGLLGMFRLLSKDELYWDAQGTQADTRYIHSLVVTGENSGKGLGSRILKQIIENLIELGVKRLRLDCDASNSRLCRYYEDQGFNKVGEKVTPHSVNNLYQMDLQEEAQG